MHPVGNYVSYDGLSESYQAFVSIRDNVQVPANIHEAIMHPGWRKAIQDEIEAHEKNSTWIVTDLPSGKRTPLGQRTCNIYFGPFFEV